MNLMNWQRYLKAQTATLGAPRTLSRLPVHPTHEMPTPFGMQARWIRKPFTFDLNAMFSRNTVFGPERPVEFFLRIKREHNLARIGVRITLSGLEVICFGDNDDDVGDFGPLAPFIDGCRLKYHYENPPWSVTQKIARRATDCILTTFALKTTSIPA